MQYVNKIHSFNIKYFRIFVIQPRAICSFLVLLVLQALGATAMYAVH
jgi:hypothetical protein